MRERYNSTIRTNDLNKIKINKILSEYASYNNRNMGNALILDTEKLLTTKALLNVGFQKDKILIPNPYSYNKIITKHTRTYDCLLNRFMKINAYHFKYKITFAFFDFMATLSGNNEVKPKDDIRDYFKYKLPNNDSIFAITVSVREANTIGHCAGISLIDFIVCREALKNGYMIIKLPEGFSYNGLYWIVYKVLIRNNV